MNSYESNQLELNSFSLTLPLRNWNFIRLWIYHYHQSLSQMNLLFLSAVENNQLSVVQWLIELARRKTVRLNPAHQHNLPLRRAARLGYLEILNYLLSLKEWVIDPRVFDSTILVEAAASGSVSLIKRLLQWKEPRTQEPLNLDFNYIPMLQIAQLKGHQLVIDYLISFLNGDQLNKLNCEQLRISNISNISNLTKLSKVSKVSEISKSTYSHSCMIEC